MSPAPPRILVLCAHPDDAEFHAGGLICMHRDLGHAVRIVSLTNGSAGHFDRELSFETLEQRRRDEAAAAGRTVGAEYVTWDIPDGRLEANLETRVRVIREIRRFAPDLVLTHRPNDYHPDHRATGQLVQDASYLVTVPRVAPDVPALRRDPVVASMVDLFTRPCPLRPDVVLDVAPYVDRIVRMLACHVSQVFEWLAYEDGQLDRVPQDEAGRLAWLRGWLESKIGDRADRFRRELVETYGPDRGAACRWVEAYEISEYASRLSDAERARLFPGMVEG